MPASRDEVMSCMGSRNDAGGVANGSAERMLDRSADVISVLSMRRGGFSRWVIDELMFIQGGSRKG